MFFSIMILPYTASRVVAAYNCLLSGAVYCLMCCLLLCTVFPVVAQNNIPYKCGNGIREPGETCDCGPEEVGYYGNF